MNLLSIYQVIVRYVVLLIKPFMHAVVNNSKYWAWLLLYYPVLPCYQGGARYTLIKLGVLPALARDTNIVRQKMLYICQSESIVANILWHLILTFDVNTKEGN